MLPSAVQRALAAVLLLAHLSGCTSWQVQGVPAAQLFADQPPKQVAVDRGDGRRIVLDGPRLSGDSIVGTVKGDTTGIPLQEASRISVRRGHAGKTVGLVVLTVAAVAAVAAVYWASTFELGCVLCGGGEEEEY